RHRRGPCISHSTSPTNTRVAFNADRMVSSSRLFQAGRTARVGVFARVTPAITFLASPISKTMHADRFDSHAMSSCSGFGSPSQTQSHSCRAHRRVQVDELPVLP